MSEGQAIVYNAILAFMSYIKCSKILKCVEFVNRLRDYFKLALILKIEVLEMMRKSHQSSLLT